MVKPGKYFVLFISLFLTLSLVTGCGGSAGDQKTAANPTQSQEAGKPAADDTLKTLFEKSQAVKGLSYTMTMSSEGKEISKGKMWIKGQKMKMENSMEGVAVVMYVDQEKKVAYNYMPEEKMATKINFDQVQQQQGESPLDYGEELKDETHYKIVGEETLNGYKCKVVEATDQSDTMKMWVSIEYGIPVKVESKIEGKTLIMDYSDIKVGDIPDSEFELPSGIQIMDMSQLMNNMPQNPPKQ